MLAPWKKSYGKPRWHIKNQRHYFTNKGLSSQSYGFSSSHVWMWELDYKESWAPKNWCFWTVVLEKTLESPLDCKEIQPVNLKGNQSRIFIGRTDAEAETNSLATWSEEPSHWKRPWCWERLKVGGEVDDRGWDGWMASLMRWRWVWVGSRSWWWTGKPGVLPFMGSQRVGHDWVTELNWTELNWTDCICGNHFSYSMKGFQRTRDCALYLCMLPPSLSLGIAPSPENILLLMIVWVQVLLANPRED